MIHVHNHIHNKKEILIPVTGYLVTASGYNHFPPLPISYAFALHKHLSWSWFFIWWEDLDLHSWRVWATGSPAWVVLL